ncbi:ribonuclease E/G, partial [Klebsiella pneumoniae]|nr:ribonuclease E/G [Klebsiella pneumoniae]
DADLVVRIVRDYFTSDVNEFVIDSQEAYNRVVDLLQYISPELIDSVTLYEPTAKDSDIFRWFNLEDSLESLRERRV